MFNHYVCVLFRWIRKGALPPVCTTWRNSKRYILKAVNATSAIGHECLHVVWIWCTVNASTHSRESRDSKGRSLVSKDIHAPRGSISVVASRRGKGARKRKKANTPWGFAESLKARLFFSLSLSPFHVCRLFFSCSLCFSSVRMTPVWLEPRVLVFDLGRERRNLFNRCS